MVIKVMDTVFNQKVSFAPIPGFPEFSIEENIVLSKVQSKIKEIYELYGYGNLDTRLVETDKVLNQKGIDSKELFSLNFIIKNKTVEPKEEQRLLALRFDLTVPMARYIAQNKNIISFPFKRYQIQKVYRAEGHKVASGRYNEFYQCDIDVVGYNNLDIAYDSEFPAIVCDILRNVFNIERFVMRISNRKLLEGLFRENGISQVDKIKRAVKVIDDIEKVEKETTIQLLNELGITLENAENILSLFRELYEKTPTEAMVYLKDYGFTDKQICEGISELDCVVNGVIANGVNEKYFKVDARIARGLDYYTGTVYETNLLDHMEIGSVCSGGRYNDLVSTLSGNPEDKYPGVGLSIGLTRLIPTLIKANYLKADTQTVAKILVTCQDKKFILKYQEIGSVLRGAGIKTDVYLNKSTNLPKQLDYANKKNYKYVIIANKYEFDENCVAIRNMETASQEKVPINDIVEYFKDKV
jgi:histidyl-tRNA synthetase